MPMKTCHSLTFAPFSTITPHKLCQDKLQNKRRMLNSGIISKMHIWTKKLSSPTRWEDNYQCAQTFVLYVCDYCTFYLSHSITSCLQKMARKSGNVLGMFPQSQIQEFKEVWRHDLWTPTTQNTKPLSLWLLLSTSFCEVNNISTDLVTHPIITVTHWMCETFSTAGTWHSACVALWLMKTSTL